MHNNWLDEAMSLERSDNVYNRKFQNEGNFERSQQIRTKFKKQKGRNITEFDNGYDEDDEDDEDGIVGRGRVKIPRVQTSDGPVGCSCFPKRSHKNIPSMLYEGLQCKHSGLKGETHAGVTKFSGNWKEEYEKADPESTMPQKSSYIIGYPRPINLDGFDQEENITYPDTKKSDTIRDELKTNSKRKSVSQNSRKNVSRRSKKDQTKQDEQLDDEKSKPFAGLVGLLDEEEEEETPPSKPLIEGITLPQIGFTPPSTPSGDKLRSRERHSARSASRSLPPLPESPFLSGRNEKSKTRRHNTIKEDGDSTDDDGDKVNQGSLDREFVGHYYDAGGYQETNFLTLSGVFNFHFK